MKLLITLLAAMLTYGMLHAAAFEQEAAFKTTKVVYSSEKPLSVGMNVLDFKLTRDGKAVTGAEVSVKVFMPKMPGMPYMEYVANAEPIGEGSYRADVNFAMPGTWQLYIFVHTADGEKQRIKSSINL